MELVVYLASLVVCFALGYLVIGWVTKRNVPAFCPTCGQAVVRYQTRGAGRFSSEQWDRAECPVFKATGPGWESHYNQILGWRKFPASFDPQTGKPR